MSLQRNSKRLFVSKAKDLDRIDFILFGLETEIGHGDQVLSPRYFFLQRTIAEHDSVLLMGGRSRSNSLEEIIPQVLSLDPPFAIFSDLCSSDFQAVESFTAQVNN